MRIISGKQVVRGIGQSDRVEMVSTPRAAALAERRSAHVGIENLGALVIAPNAASNLRALAADGAERNAALLKLRPHLRADRSGGAEDRRLLY